MVGNRNAQGGSPCPVNSIGLEGPTGDEASQGIRDFVGQERGCVDLFAGDKSLPDPILRRILPRIATDKDHRHIGVYDDRH